MADMRGVRASGNVRLLGGWVVVLCILVGVVGLGAPRAVADSLSQSGRVVLDSAGEPSASSGVACPSVVQCTAIVGDGSGGHV